MFEKIYKIGSTKIVTEIARKEEVECIKDLKKGRENELQGWENEMLMAAQKGLIESLVLMFTQAQVEEIPKQ